MLAREARARVLLRCGRIVLRRSLDSRHRNGRSSKQTRPKNGRALRIGPREALFPYVVGGGNSAGRDWCLVSGDFCTRSARWFNATHTPLNHSGTIILEALADVVRIVEGVRLGQASRQPEANGAVQGLYGGGDREVAVLETGQIVGANKYMRHIQGRLLRLESVVQENASTALFKGPDRSLYGDGYVSEAVRQRVEGHFIRPSSGLGFVPGEKRFLRALGYRYCGVLRVFAPTWLRPGPIYRLVGYRSAVVETAELSRIVTKARRRKCLAVRSIKEAGAQCDAFHDEGNPHGGWICCPVTFPLVPEGLGVRFRRADLYPP